MSEYKQTPTTGGIIIGSSNGNVLDLKCDAEHEFRIAPSADDPTLVRVWIVRKGTDEHSEFKARPTHTYDLVDRTQWTCGRCSWANHDLRKKCRNCNKEQP